MSTRNSLRVLNFLANAKNALGPCYTESPCAFCGVTQVDEDLTVYWINTWSNDVLVRQGDAAISANTSYGITSFSGHKFLVVEQQVSTFSDEIQQ